MQTQTLLEDYELNYGQIDDGCCTLKAAVDEERHLTRTSATAENPSGTIPTRRSVVWAELPLECLSERNGERLKMAGPGPMANGGSQP